MCQVRRDPVGGAGKMSARLERGHLHPGKMTGEIALQLAVHPVKGVREIGL